METEEKNLRIVLHPHAGKELPLRAFADYLVSLHKALKLCDRKINGRTSHHWTIVDCTVEDGSVEVLIREYASKPKRSCPTTTPPPTEP
jgi:hypothetical protein